MESLFSCMTAWSEKKSKLPEAMEHAICQVTIDFIFHLTGWEERTIFLS